MNRILLHFKLAFSGLGLLFLGACHGVEQPLPESLPEKSQETEINSLSFTEVGLPIKMSLDFPFLEEKTVDIRYNSQLGQYEITIDDQLEVVIVEDQISLDEIKAELLNDQLFSYTIYDEGTDSFTSHAKLPGGDPFTYNYYRKMEFGNATFLVSTNLESEYTMNRVNQLKKIINSFQFIQ